MAQDVSINIKTNAQDAIKNLREMEQRISNMERKSNRLNNLEQQGSSMQKGFITPRQVMLYRNILREMTQLHESNIKTMEQAEQKLSKIQTSNHIKRLKELDEEIQKRQVQYTESSTRGASQTVQDFYLRKLEESRYEYDSIENSNEYKELIKSQEVLEESIRDLSQRLDNSSVHMQIAQQHTGNLDNLRVKDSYNSQMVDGVGSLAQMAMPIGLIGGALYLSEGVHNLREQERAAWMSSQKMDSFNGTGQHDEALRQDIMKVGIKNNYGALDTGMLLSTLISGGTQGNLDGRKDDIDSVQRFSRANAVDSSLVGSLGAEFQKLGSLTEGNLNTYTERIAGAIEKSGMQGREEEMLRSNFALVSSVSQGLSGISSERALDLTGLQTLLSESIPSLSGDRGAEFLSNVDSSIKGGDNSFDLIMGKGVLPEFGGMMGAMKLSRLKEQGASTEALQYYLQGLDRYYGTGTDKRTHELKAATIKEQLGISMETYDKMVSSGMADRLKSGNSVSDKELRSLGDESINRGMDNYNESSTAEVDSMEAWTQNRSAEAAQPIDEVDKGARGLFNSLPEWMQTGAIYGTTMLGGYAMAKTLPKVGKMLSPRAGNYPGGGLGGRISDTARNLSNGARNIGSNVIDGARNIGSNMPSSLRGLGSGADDLIKGSAPLLQGATKAIPLVGGLATMGVDQLANPENSWMESAFKGIGSVAGGALGLMGAGALGLGTGGAGLLAAPAMGIGGSVAGEKLGGGIYDLLFGDKYDKKLEQSSTTSVDNEVSSNVDRMLKQEKQEHVVRIVVEGSIDGMNASNEDKIADGIQDHFTKIIKSGGINLSLAQTRMTT